MASAAVVVLVTVAGTAYAFRKDLILYAVATRARDATPVAPNREVVWEKGPETASVPEGQRPPNIVVILADDLMDAEPSAMVRMAQAFEEEGASLLGVEEVPRDQTQSYGIVTIDRMADDLARIHSIVEKPRPAEAPSNLAVIGRYVLTPRIFDLLAEISPGAGGEIQLTDAISSLLRHERALAVRLPGRRFDCGSKLGYLEASVEFGLRHPDIGEDFARYLKSR